MEKDVKSLLEFRTSAVEKLSVQLRIDQSEANKIFRLMEAEDLLKIEAPEYENLPATVLVEDRRLERNNLSFTSHKAGNIVVNTYLDWKTLVGAVCASVETLAGLCTDNPVLLVTGILSCLLSISTLTSLKITENGTAIIMALQQHSKHKIYMATEEQCMREANDILRDHNYPEMDAQTFQRELSILNAIKCIDIINGKIKLIEKVVLHY